MNRSIAATTGNVRRRLAAGLVAAIAMAGAACSGGSDLSPTGPSSSQASTPAVSGTWTGTLTQPGGPIGDVFTYTAALVQSGTVVSGTATTERLVNGQRYYVQHTLSGRVNGMGVELNETAIVSQQNVPGSGWCSKAVTLTLGTSRRQMTGTWSAPGCLPGAVSISK